MGRYCDILREENEGGVNRDGFPSSQSRKSWVQTPHSWAEQTAGAPQTLKCSVGNVQSISKRPGSVSSAAAAAAEVASAVSDSVRPHRRKPTRLPRPWDSPGKNTGVGCHFLLQCMKVKSERKSLSHVRLLATPWTAAHQTPPSMGFSRQEYWSGVPLPSPTILLVLHNLTKMNNCKLLNF